MYCTCTAHCLHMHCTCTAHVLHTLHMHCTCTAHVLHMYCTLSPHVLHTLHMYCTCTAHSTDHCWSDGPTVSAVLLFNFRYVSFVQMGSGGVTHEASLNTHAHMHTHMHAHTCTHTHAHTHTHTHTHTQVFHCSVNGIHYWLVRQKKTGDAGSN